MYFATLCARIAMNEIGSELFPSLCAFLTCSKPLYDFCVLLVVLCWLFSIKMILSALPAATTKAGQRNSAEWNRSSFGWWLRLWLLPKSFTFACSSSGVNDMAWLHWPVLHLFAANLTKTHSNCTAQPMGVRKPPTPLREPLGSSRMTPAGHRRICNSIFALTLPRLHTNEGLQWSFGVGN